MKLHHSLTLCLLSLGLAGVQAQEVKLNVPGKAEAAAPAAPAFTDAQLVEEFGWFVGKRVGLTELEFSPAEIEALVKGLKAAAAGKDSPFPLEKIGPAMDEFMQKKQGAYMGKLKQKSMNDNLAFFTKLKENKNVVELPSGLRYEILKPGAGENPKAADTVKVHYTGTLIDGTVFDSSVQRGEPISFPLNGVIPGWTEGVQLMKVGDKFEFTIPSNLAYGEQGAGGAIGPNSTLVFQVELLGIEAGK